MKEILGGSLEKLFAFYGIKGKKTYEGKTYIDDKTQIWEISDENFEKLSEMSDEEWESNGFLYCWWRHSTGSVYGGITARYNINNHYIQAYDSYNREEAEINSEINGEEFWRDRKYKNLMEYLEEEIDVTAERNVAAISVDLAEMNDISLGELFRKYQG